MMGRMPTYSFGDQFIFVKYCERMVAQYLLEASGGFTTYSTTVPAPATQVNETLPTN